MDSAELSTEDRPRRAYRSSRRSQQAAQTRRDVIDAAAELFATQGFSGTTIAAIAERAGVSPETVYSGFGSKKRLLRTAMEVAIVGDTDDVPLAERAEFRRIGEGEVEARLDTVAALAWEIHERSAGLWRAVGEAAATDEDIRSWHREMEQGRRSDAARAMSAIFGCDPDDVTLDLVATLVSGEAYLVLVDYAGMSRVDYEQRVREGVRRLMAPLLTQAPS
jgi:AcrR family transcriptional regulator